MGKNFISLLHCPGSGVDALDAIERLEHSSDEPAFAEVLACGRRNGFAFADNPELRPRWRKWSDQTVLPARPTLPSTDVCLSLPSDFLLIFGEDAVCAWHSLRWMFMFTEPEWQPVMLNAVKRLRQLLRAEDCIITTDWNPACLSFMKGLPFADSLETARQKGEGEVACLADLYVETTQAWDSRGYWRLRP